MGRQLKNLTPDECEDVRRLKTHLQENPMPITEAREWGKENTNLNTTTVRFIIEQAVRSGELSETHEKLQSGPGRPARVIGGE
jgi:hypothetical protein